MANLLLTSYYFLLTFSGSISPLTGTVRALDASGMGGATVVVYQHGQRTATTTDKNGAFTFSDVTLPAIVEVSAAGFMTMTRVVMQSPADFTLSPAGVTDSVVVQHDRESAWRELDSGATVLSASDIAHVPAETLDEALRVISGFSLFRRSSSRYSNPTTHGVTMRGLSASGSSRALILLDGVPLNDGFGGWVTWTRLPSMAIDRVDIERGAEGDLFGSDALGGVIRIVTSRTVRPSASFAVDAGSLGVRTTDLAIGERHKAVAVFGAGSWLQMDGSIPLAPEVRGAVDRPASAKWVSGLGRADVSGSGRRLTISFWGWHDTRNNGTVVQVNRMSGSTGIAAFDMTRGDFSIAARLSAAPNRFYQTFSSVAASRATETLISTQTVEATTTRAVGEISHAIPTGYVRFSTTISREHATFQDVPTIPDPKGLRDDSEAFVEQIGFAPVDQLTINGGARQEWRVAPTSTDQRDRALIGHASAAWRLSNGIVLRGSAASGHRWPTLNELVRNFRAGNTLTVANPSLDPERATSFDAQLSVQRRRWLASIDAFRTVVDGAIANVTQSVTPSLVTRMRQNTGEAHANGAELDVEFRPLNRVRVRASGTLIDSHFRHSLEPALEGKLLPQVPRTSWSLSGDVRLPWRIDASVLVHGVSTQFDDDRNTPALLLARARQLDVQIGGRIAQFGWQLVVENATNARIEVGRTSATLVTIAPPRAVRVGVSWRR